MSADADPRRDLPAHAKHATGHVRPVEQCDFKTTGEVYRTISVHHRRVYKRRATLGSTNELIYFARLVACLLISINRVKCAILYLRD